MGYLSFNVEDIISHGTLYPERRFRRGASASQGLSGREA